MNISQRTFAVQVRDFCDLTTNAIDLNKLFRLSEQGQNQLALRREAWPVKRTALAGLLTAPAQLPMKRGVARALFAPPVRPLLDGGTFRELAPAIRRLFPQRAEPKTSPKLPKPRKYELGKTKGTISQWPASADLEDLGKQTITLPHFLGRHITAAALKTLSGHTEDVILKKKGAKWVIVSDDHVIDLADPSQVYRVGPVQVYS